MAQISFRYHLRPWGRGLDAKTRSPALTNAPVPVSFAPLPSDRLIPVGVLPVEKEDSPRGFWVRTLAFLQKEGAWGQLAMAHRMGKTDISKFKPAFCTCGWDEQKHPRSCDRERLSAFKGGRGGRQMAAILLSFNDTESWGAAGVLETGRVFGP